MVYFTDFSFYFTDILSLFIANVFCHVVSLNMFFPQRRYFTIKRRWRTLLWHKKYISVNLNWKSCVCVWSLLSPGSRYKTDCVWTRNRLFSPHHSYFPSLLFMDWDHWQMYVPPRIVICCFPHLSGMAHIMPDYTGNIRGWEEQNTFAKPGT